MDEYIKYIKWLGMLIYKKELEQLKDENVEFIFFDDMNYSVKEENNDKVFILYNENIQDTIHKLYKYIFELKKYFKIMDISIFKGNDKECFSSTYLISIYCVEIEKFNNNTDKYNKVFSSNINNANILIEKIYTIIDREKTNKIAINDIPQNEENKKINDLYIKMLDNVIKYEDMNLKELRDNFVAYKKNEPNYILKNDEIEKNILENIEIKYIDDFLKLKNRRKIKKYYILNKKFKRNRNNSYKYNYNKVIVLDYEENTEFDNIIKIIENNNLADCIIINSNEKSNYKKNNTNIQFTNNLKNCIKSFKGLRILYITNKNKESNMENIVHIKIDNINKINEKDFINKIIEQDTNLSAFANLDHINSVKVLTGTFLNFDGDNYYSGGAERYLIDLYEVCRGIGLKLRIYQKANFNFFRFYNDIEIVGLTCNNEQYNYQYEQDMKILKSYCNVAQNKTKLNIYSSFLECHGVCVKPSIGISHGVAWDNKLNKFDKNNMNDKAWIIDSAKACDKLISVDRNTANYFQTVDYLLGNSTEVVPNYVNIDEFIPYNNKENNNIVILYPRRLYEGRGMYLLLDITDELMQKYNNIEIHFVGKGFEEDTNNIQKKINKWGNDKIKMYNCPPEKMNEVYKIADISVIPTLYSEGTSLSCLEAMASENAVIATRIGGLPDLIINRYNGILIEPNSKSLYNAIIEYIENPELMNKCKKNAREVAKSFNKNIWIERWKKIIEENSLKKDHLTNIKYEIVKIYVKKDKINNYNLNKVILENLLNNKIVYIVTDVIIKEKSYERLQYVSNKSEFYKKADYVFVDKEYEGKVLENEYQNIEL